MPNDLDFVTGEGMLYVRNEYEMGLGESGFSNIKMIRLKRDHGKIIGVKAA